MSFLSKLKEAFSKKEDKAQYLAGFQKTNETFGDALSKMEYEFHGCDDDFLEQLTIILLESDVGIETADLICDKLKEKCKDFPSLTFHWTMNFLMEIMKEIYDEYEDVPVQWNENGTTVFFLEGVNGSGKTTTAAKLAYMWVNQGKKVAFIGAGVSHKRCIEQFVELGAQVTLCDQKKSIEDFGDYADTLRRRIREIENNKDATAVEQDLMTTLEVCYEFCLRGFHFEPIDIYRSDATKFIVTENGLLPPFTSVRGLGETAALDTVEKRKGKDFTSVEEFSLCCNKLSQTHIDQLRALGAFAGLPETSQLTLF